MTISSETDKVQYAGDGTTSDFPVTFVFWDEDDLRVILSAADGNETVWTRGTQFNVTGGAGGTGTVSAIAMPTDYRPQSGERLTIKSNLGNKQQTSLPLGGSFPSTAVEEAMDKIVRLIQQADERLGRAILMPESDPAGITLTAPSVMMRAQKAVIFDADGNLTVSDDDYNDQEAAVAASATAAAGSEVAAAASQSAAASSASAAATSQTAAHDSELAAASSAAAASVGATNTFKRFTFTAAGGETSLTGADDQSMTLGYVAGVENVFLNGTLLVRGSDYTATNGTSIAGLSALTAGDVVTVEALGTYQVADALSGLSGTSATSLTIGSGSKSFTTQSDKLFAVGSFVLAVSSADPTNYMFGQVASYSGTALSVTVSATGGSGSHSDWTIRVSGAIGLSGATGPTGPTGPAAMSRFRFVASGGETSLSGADADSATLAYTAGHELVHLNGILLVRGQDYTATNGTSITALSALAASDVVNIIAL